MKTKIQILRNPRPESRTHALDCPWAKGVYCDYVIVDAKTVPASHPRCSRCGGG